MTGEYATAIGKLAGAHPTDTLGHVMMKVLERQGLDSGQVDQIVGPARQLKFAGVDAVNIVDSPRAQSRMGAVPAALASNGAPR